MLGRAAVVEGQRSTASDGNDTEFVIICAICLDNMTVQTEVGRAGRNRPSAAERHVTGQIVAGRRGGESCFLHIVIAPIRPAGVPALRMPKEKCVFLLNIIIRQGAVILQQLLCIGQQLLIGRNPLLVLYLCLDVFNRIAGFDLQRDTRSRLCFHEELHSACGNAETEHHDKRQCYRNNSLFHFIKTPFQKFLSAQATCLLFKVSAASGELHIAA